MHITRFNFILLVPYTLAIVLNVHGLKSLNEDTDKSSTNHHDTLRYNAAAAAAAATSYPSSYYNGGYPSGGPYRYSYNGIGSADPYEKTARDYASPSSNSAGYIDLIPAADGGGGGHGGGHGGGGHGHGQAQHGGGGGWGWGWGHGGGHGSYTKVNNTGFGLLGLLGLLSLLQAVLASMTTTTMMTGRKKRMVEEEQNEKLDIHQRISQLILPNLNVIAHVSNGNLSVECTHRETCLMNAILLKELGPQGYMVGQQMSGAILNLVKGVDKSELTMRHIETAGQNGRRGMDCYEMYPTCKEMTHINGTIKYPVPLLT